MNPTTDELIKEWGSSCGEYDLRDCPYHNRVKSRLQGRLDVLEKLDIIRGKAEEYARSGNHKMYRVIRDLMYRNGIKDIEVEGFCINEEIAKIKEVLK